MNFRTAAVAVLILVASGHASRAHDFIAGVGAWNGFLHPLLVPAHALSVFALGLMTGQQDRTSRVILAGLFAAAMIAGIFMIMGTAFPLDIMPEILLGGGAAAGLLTALAKPLPRFVPALLLAAGGLALIFDSVPSVISKRDTILSLVATVAAAALLLGLVATAAAMLTRGWQRIGVRILGSWSAASALLVLALRFVR